MKKLIFFMLLFIIPLSACSQSKSAKKIGDIVLNDNYRATVEVTVHGNKADSKYKMEHFCMLPDQIRVNTMEPNFLKTKVIIKNGQKWVVYHPLMKQAIHADNLMSNDELILIGIINKSFCDKQVVGVEEYGNKRYLCVKKSLKNFNEYRATAVLYLDEHSKRPEFLNILDDKGVIKVEIKYLEYTVDTNIQKDLFKLN